VADRVLIKMGNFKASSFEELFQQTKALPWAEWLPENANFPVQGKSVNSTLHSVPDCQAIVKKAIVENLKRKYRKEWFPEDGPKYTVEVALLKDEATLTIDTSGSGLHKRGYRKLSSDAPLKETLAAAMIKLAHWFPDRVLMDPFCGSGTIPIEAALIGLNIAPGIKRSFAAEQWPAISKGLWQEAWEEALAVVETDRKLRIIGTDIDHKVLSLARYHSKLAGVEDQIHFQKLPLSDVKTKSKYGYIICNPPYGERIGEAKEVENLYREMGQVFGNMDTWSYYILTANSRFEKLFARPATKRRKLYNGRIECPKPPHRLRSKTQD